MNFRNSSISMIGILAALAVAGSVAQAQFQRPSAQAGSLKGNVGRQQVTPVPCNSVSACNQIIAYCVANNGTWVEESHNGQGQPSKGTCYLP